MKSNPKKQKKVKIVNIGVPHDPTQNEREIKLLRIILANVFALTANDIMDVQHRAMALGRLEGMIEYKELMNKPLP